MSDTYVCEMCGVSFESEWSDEEAKAEAGQVFGEGALAGGVSVVCDDCYAMLVPVAP